MCPVKRKQSFHYALDFDGVEIPIQIIHERRNNVRSSIGHKSAILRLPTHLSHKKQSQYVKEFSEWMQTQLRKKPDLLDSFRIIPYQDGDLLNTTYKSYHLKLIRSDRKTGTGKIDGNWLRIQIPEQLTRQEEGKMLSSLIARCVADDLKPLVLEKVLRLNDVFFKKPIQSVRLKNTVSKWGSCSSDGKISLSTRLLLAPEEVIDYVIVHELAHLVELNHSPRFWNEVKRCLPGYLRQEKWLKEHGNSCRF